MRPAAVGRLCAILALSLAITGCSERSDEASNRQSAAGPSASNGAVDGSGGPHAPAAQSPAAENQGAGVEAKDPSAIVAQLTAPGAPAIEGSGFTMNGPLTCTSPGSDDAWAARCAASIADEGRGPAEVNLFLFDRDQDFEAAKAVLMGNMDRAHRWSVEQKYHVDMPNGQDPRGSSRVPASCYQAVGGPTDYAACLVMPRPRIMLYAIVSPAGSTGAGKPDLQHAAALAVVALLKMNQAF